MIRIDHASIIFVFSIVLIISVTVLPIIYTAYMGSIGEYGDLNQAFSTDVMLSVLLTIYSSGIASAIAIMLSFPAAYYLSRYRYRSRILRFVDALLDLPATVPHPLVGIALLIFLGSQGPLAPYINIFGLDGFAYTIYALILAQLVVSQPIALRSLVGAFNNLDAEPEIAALTFGVSRLKVFMFIAVPRVFRDALNSYATTFARAVSEFGSISIIAYYVVNPPFINVKPAPVLIWDLFETGGLARALPATFTLILLSIFILVAIKLTERRGA